MYTLDADEKETYSFVEAVLKDILERMKKKEEDPDYLICEED